MRAHGGDGRRHVDVGNGVLFWVRRDPSHSTTVGRRNGRRAGGRVGGREEEWWGGAYVVRWCWGKGLGGGAIGGIVIVSLDPLFIVVAFLSQTSLDLRATGHTGPGGAHTLPSKVYKITKVAHTYMLTGVSYLIKTLNIYIIHVSVKLEYVELQMKI